MWGKETWQIHQKCSNCGFDLSKISNTWTNEENDILLKEYLNGESINNLSKKFNKTTGQIRYQIKKLSKGKFCHQCLHKIVNNESICSNCGNKILKVNSSENINYKVESKEEKNNNYTSKFYETPIEIFERLKMKYPEYILFIQNGYFLEVYREDAKICSEIFGWETSDARNDIFTGVPTNAFKFKDKLKKMGKKYIIVRQDNQDYKSNKIVRSVYDKYP